MQQMQLGLVEGLAKVSHRVVPLLQLLLEGFRSRLSGCAPWRPRRFLKRLQSRTGYGIVPLQQLFLQRRRSTLPLRIVQRPRLFLKRRRKRVGYRVIPLQQLFLEGRQAPVDRTSRLGNRANCLAVPRRARLVTLLQFAGHHCRGGTRLSPLLLLQRLPQELIGGQTVRPSLERRRRRRVPQFAGVPPVTV